MLQQSVKTAKENKVMLKMEGAADGIVQGGELLPQNTRLKDYVETPTTRGVLTAMMQEHALGRSLNDAEDARFQCDDLSVFPSPHRP